MADAIERSAEGPLLGPGVCHCVAVWVDYCLFDDSALSPPDAAGAGDRATQSGCSSDGNAPAAQSAFIRQWNGDFPPYLNVNLKFFPTPVAVTANQQLVVSATFTPGDSDFDFRFNVKTK